MDLNSNTNHINNQNKSSVSNRTLEKNQNQIHKENKTNNTSQALSKCTSSDSYNINVRINLDGTDAGIKLKGLGMNESSRYTEVQNRYNNIEDNEEEEDKINLAESLINLGGSYEKQEKL